MIPTTFVMGAGVSIPFGFPSGEDLMDEVITIALQYRKLSSTHPVHRCVSHVLSDEDRELIPHFGHSLDRGSPRSIDHFVETNPRFANIAKAIITQILLGYESSFIENVFKTRRKIKEKVGSSYQEKEIPVPNALRYIFHKIAMASNFDLELSRHNFITFNYEHTLEHFIYNTYRYGRQQTEYECVNRLSQLQEHSIIHVYGQLGEYDAYIMDQIQEQNHAYNFDPRLIANGLKQLSFIDRTNPDKQKQLLEDMSNLFKRTNRVVLLGFGYENTNMTILRKSYGISQGIDDDTKGALKSKLDMLIRQNWYGSALGKLNEERKEIDRQLPMIEDDLRADGKYQSNRGDPTMNDLQFLKQWVNLTCT